MRRLLAFLALGTVWPAAAATFVETSVEETARGSEAVVHGTVVSRTSRMTADGGAIYTEVEVAVESAWKGAPGGIVRLVVPGGRVGGIAQVVDASPAFAEGEEVVVFLARRSGSGWRVTGRALGKYRVEGDRALPAVGRAEMIPRALAAGERAIEPMPVAELERRVRGAQ